MALSASLAQAQGDDKAYCAQLSEIYRKYVQKRDIWGPGARRM